MAVEPQSAHDHPGPARGWRAGARRIGRVGVRVRLVDGVHHVGKPRGRTSGDGHVHQCAGHRRPRRSLRRGQLVRSARASSDHRSTVRFRRRGPLVDPSVRAGWRGAPDRNGPSDPAVREGRGLLPGHRVLPAPAAVPPDGECGRLDVRAAGSLLPAGGRDRRDGGPHRRAVLPEADANGRWSRQRRPRPATVLPRRRHVRAPADGPDHVAHHATSSTSWPSAVAPQAAAVPDGGRSHLPAMRRGRPCRPGDLPDQGMTGGGIEVH